MSPNTVVAGGVSEFSEPRSTPYDSERYSIRYNRTRTALAFNVEASVAPPKSLLLDIEVESENGAFSLRAVQVDVTVEEEESQDAFFSLVDAVKGWLEFLQDEQPDLASDLESQRHYTRLLHYDPDTWFGQLLIS